MKSWIVTSAEGSGVSTSAKLGCSSRGGGAGGAARIFSSRIEAKVAKALSAPCRLCAAMIWSSLRSTDEGRSPMCADCVCAT
jgi:hypothetical protein